MAERWTGPREIVFEVIDGFGRGGGAIGGAGGRAQRATGSTSPPPDRNLMGRGSEVHAPSFWQAADASATNL